MAKCKFKWPKCSLWNIECGNIEHVHRSSCQYSPELAGVSVSGMAMVLTKKYENKLTKVTRLTDIVMLALAVSEMNASMLNDRKIDEREFNMLQTLHSKARNDLSKDGSEMATETRSQFVKSLLEGINDLRKELRRDASWRAWSFLCVIWYVTKTDKLQSIYYQPSHLWKEQKAIKKLKELGKEKPAVTKQWLLRQAFWQSTVTTSKACWHTSLSSNNS